MEKTLLELLHQEKLKNFGCSSCWEKRDNLPKQIRGVCDRLRSALTSLCCESAIVTLSLVSGLAITGEILIDYGILIPPTGSSSSSPRQETFHTNGSSNNSTSATPAEEETRRAETMKTVEKVFHYISLAIAAIFLIEIILKLLVFRMALLLNHWQVLDMLVVFATVMVEVAYEIEDTIPELECTTYIVLFRLWRIPYACNIKAKAVQKALEQDIEVWKAGKTKLEQKCASLEAKSNKQKEKIERLERELSALREEAKDSRQAKQAALSPPAPVTSTNGKVPRDVVDGYVSTYQHPSQSHMPSDDGMTAHASGHNRAYSEDEDTVDGSPVSRTTGLGEEEDRVTEEDTLDKGDGEDIDWGRKVYFRSGSDSSLSYQNLEHEVHVQIEEQDNYGDGAGRHTGDQDSTNILMRQKGRSEPVCYDNSGYSPDGEDGEIQGELLHEIDGAKTYRSAGGIPMTSL